MDKTSISSMIDHTLLKGDCTKREVENICMEAIEYKFASVCVNPSFVPLCSELLNGTEVKVCTVIGFPLGSNSTYTKVFEAKDAVLNGAKEIDMVINIGKLKDKDYDYIREEIKSVVDAVNEKAIVKVIIEACLLSKEEKILACKLSKEAGAHFVKTSTGFSTGGATEEDIILMRETVGDTMGVKASGGIRDLKTLLTMVQSGANRIGASASIKIIDEI